MPRSSPSVIVHCQSCQKTIYEKEITSKRAVGSRVTGVWEHRECYNQNLYRKRKAEGQTVEIELPLYGSPSNEQCLFESCLNNNVIIIENERRISCSVSKGIVIEKGCCVCIEHFTKLVTLDFESTDLTKIADSFWLTPNENTHFIRSLLDSAKKKLRKPFQFSEMTDTELKQLTSLNRSEFEQFKSSLDFSRTQESNRINDPDVTLGLYLLKMRSGLSDYFISALFKMTRQTVDYHIKNARKIIFEQHTINYLGFQSVDSDHILAHTTDTAKTLFGANNLIVAMDGTYVYCQKSSNFKFQRSSFSMDKHRNLVKMFLIVTTDGYVVDAIGPHNANASDSTLLENLLTSNSSFTNLFLPNNSVFVVDRGFRNVIPKCQELGYDVKMPHFMPSGAKQLTCEQANESRLVTKVRWIVEDVNGQIKQTFQHFNKTLQNVLLDNVEADFKNCLGILNHFHKCKSSDFNNPAITHRIMTSKNKENLLANVDISKLVRNRSFFDKKIDDPSIDTNYGFPRLDLSEIELFCCGTYQIKMARSYYGEHINADGRYHFAISKSNVDFEIPGINAPIDELVLFKCRMNSRHSGGVKYNQFILVDKRKEGIQSFSEYYCSCKTGLRTIGCCAHVACFIWYFCWARYQVNITAPAASLSTLFKNLSSLPEYEQFSEEEIENELEDMIECEIIFNEDDDNE